MKKLLVYLLTLTMILTTCFTTPYSVAAATDEGDVIVEDQTEVDPDTGGDEDLDQDVDPDTGGDEDKDQEVDPDTGGDEDKDPEVDPDKGTEVDPDEGTEENVIQKIAFSPVKELSFIVGTGEKNDEGNYSYTVEFVKGDKLTVTTKDGEKEYTYIPGEETSYFEATDGSKINADDVSVEDAVEGKNTVVVSYNDVECSVPVTFVENSVESIGFTPAEEISFTSGTGDKDDEGNYSYTVEFKAGDKLAVTYKEGKKEFTYTQGDEESYFLASDGTKIKENEVTIGEAVEGQKTVTISYSGKECSVPVTFVENSVESIGFTPAEEISFTSGTGDKDDEGNYSYTVEFKAGDKLAVTYKEGKKEFTYTQGDEESYFLASDGTKIKEDEVTIGEAVEGQKTVTISYSGKECSVPVTFVENSVESIGFTPAEEISFTSGTGDKDEEGNYSYTVEFKAGDKLAVTYKEGKKEFTYTQGDEESYFLASDGTKIKEDEVTIGEVAEGQKTVTISYSGKECSVPVTFVENSVESIGFTPAEEISFTSGTGDKDEEGNYSYTVEFKAGDKLAVTYKEGKKEFTYTQGDEESYFLASDGTKIKEDEVTIGEVAEGQKTVTISYSGKECSVPVTFVENSVESIGFTPAEEISFTSGTGDKDDEGNYSYTVEFKAGDKLAVTYKEGKKEFTYTQGDEESYFLAADGTKIKEDEVTIGEVAEGQKTVTISYSGKECSVPVTFVENCVESIGFTPAEEISFTSGTGDKDDEGNYSYTVEFKAGDKLAVTYKEGKKEFTYTQGDEESYFLAADGTKIKEDEVTIGEVAEGQKTVTISYSGKECSVPVTFVENTVTSIKFEPKEKVTFTVGTGEKDEDGKEFFSTSFKQGDKLTVTYKDGTKDYLYTEGEEDSYFEASDGSKIAEDAVEISDTQSENPWTIDGNNIFTVTYSGKSCNVPVTILGDKILNISYKPAKAFSFVENTNGSWEDFDDENPGKYFSYDINFAAGDTFTVAFRDGTSKTYKYVETDDDSYFASGSDKISLDEILWKVEQSEKPLTVGNNTITLLYMGHECTFNVTVKENPVESIAYSPINKNVYEYQKDGDWDEREYEDEQGNIKTEAYYLYMLNYNEGDVLTVKYKDKNKGTVKYTYEYSEKYDESFFISKTGERLSEEDVVLDDTQYEKPWTKGNNNSFNITFMGHVLNVKVTVCKHSYDNGKVTTKATFSKNGVKTYTCSGCKSTKTSSIAKVSTPKLSTTQYTYNGKAKKPGVTVKDSKGTTLKNKTDYTVTYPKTSSAVGNYSVVVNLKGNYSGSKTLSFRIVPVTTSITKFKPASKAFNVSWKKQDKGTTGYQIRYSLDSKFKKAKTVTVGKAKTTSTTIKKLSAKKKYYVQIRTYKTITVNKKKVNLTSSWSKTKTVKTK